MSMFDSYNNLREHYIPSNVDVSLPIQRKTYESGFPHVELDRWGNPNGYSWQYGETGEIEFPLNKVVYVEENAIVYTERGEHPTTATEGTYGQRAYNTVDLKTWVCKTLDKNIYVWEEMVGFSYPKNGVKEIHLGALNHPVTAVIQIYNFREELIYSKSMETADKAILIIDEELSKKLLKGTYSCSVTVIDNSIKKITECKLVVK